MTDTQVERRFFRHIYFFSQKVLLGIHEGYVYLDEIPWIRRALWALGELGYRDVILKFLVLNKYATDAHVDDSDKSRFYFAQKWIRDKYFPKIPIRESIDWNNIMNKIEANPHPRYVKIDSLKDIDDYDDLPPDVIETLSDFM